MRSGTVILPTSCSVAAIRSMPSMSSRQPSRAAIATACSATARECSCSACMRMSTARASVAAQLSRSAALALSRSGRPWREAYSRTSAWRMSSSSSIPSIGKVAIPTEHGARSPSVSTSRVVLSSASIGPMSANRTASSSPPIRPIASAGLTERLSASTTQRSSSSPAAWPWWSLTSLKWSMSSTSTAPSPASRVAALSTATARSSKPRRFRQPVSGSARETSISAAR